MRAHPGGAIGLEEVADAAGCSLRSLHDVFRRFRGTTPLAALHAVRLDQVRAELAGSDVATTMEVARRFGFTNRGRFTSAYAERFGEAPPGARRRS
jgi:transcriptional regulator GlxA family with amidase domain